MLPQVIVETGGSPTSKATPKSTGTGFFTGISRKGPIDDAVFVRNMEHAKQVLGERSPESALDYDSLEAFFQEGGAMAWFQRYVGPEAALAKAVLSDAEEEDSLEVVALSPGEWANSLKVKIEESEDGFNLVIVDADEKVLEESGTVATPEAAEAQMAKVSKLIKVVNKGGGNPEEGTTALAGGKADLEHATPAGIIEAMEKHRPERGPGVMFCAGRTDADVHAAMRDLGAANNRVARIDLADTAVVGTLTSATAAYQATEENAEVCATYWPWAEIPPLATGGLPRVVPWSVIQGGIEARNDGLGIPQNQAAAGDFGVARYATGLSQTALSKEDEETLYAAGVNIVKEIDGQFVTYGDKTLADPEVDDTWIDVGNVRLRMAIVSDAHEIGDRYIFRQIDGKRKLISEFGASLLGMLLPYYNNDSLFGETFEEAARVDVSDQVNTPETIAEKKLLANIQVRMSPNGEWVGIKLIKVRTTEAV